MSRDASTTRYQWSEGHRHGRQTHIFVRQSPSRMTEVLAAATASRGIERSRAESYVVLDLPLHPLYIQMSGIGHRAAKAAFCSSPARIFFSPKDALGAPGKARARTPGPLLGAGAVESEHLGRVSNPTTRSRQLVVLFWSIIFLLVQHFFPHF